MTQITKRRVFEAGHRRKFVVVVDGTPECEVALFFAARVAERTGSAITLFHCRDEHSGGNWFSLSSVSADAGGDDASQMFATYRGKLKEYGFEALHTETVTRRGQRADEIRKFIEQDEDVSVLVLGAAADYRGPGPLVASLATGSSAGEFPVPIYLVPGHLTLEEIRALA